MKYGYARVIDGRQSVMAQVEQLTRAGAEKVFREKVSGAITHRQQLKRVLDSLNEGDVLLVTRLDRLARNPRSAQYAGTDNGEESGLSFSWGYLGRHNYGPRQINAHA